MSDLLGANGTLVDHLRSLVDLLSHARNDAEKRHRELTPAAVSIMIQRVEAAMAEMQQKTRDLERIRQVLHQLRAQLR